MNSPYPCFRAPWSPDLAAASPAAFEVGRDDDDRRRGRDRWDRDDHRWGRRGWGRDDWARRGVTLEWVAPTYAYLPAYAYWPQAYWPPPPPYAYPQLPQYPYPQYPQYPLPQYPLLPPPAMIAGGRAAVGASPAAAGAARGDRPMNGYNPYANPYAAAYPYGMVGQAPPLVPVPPQVQAMQAAQIQAMQGFVPVYNNGLAPAIRSDLPTNRVLAEVDAIDARAVPVLVPEMGISPRTNLMKGFKHASEKICGKGCGHVLLRTDFPFLIEHLWVDSSDACKFEIELIAVGQRILSTGDGFNAKWLRRRSGRHGFRFDFNMAIDHRHPLKFYVKNKSSHSKRFRIAAWGEQIGE